MAAQYPEFVNSHCIVMDTDVMETLSKITAALFCAFEARYAGML